MKVKIADLYDLSNTIAAPLLERFEYPWEALAHIKEFILELGPTLPADEFDNPAEGVWIAKDAKIYDSAYMQVPHYNYVGDSILGFGAHMGAGAITSNLKSDRSLVVVKDFATGETIETGLKKFGAMLGDGVEVGCNTVMNPGTVIGCHSNVYPLSRVRGFVPALRIFKDPGNIVEKW